MPQKLEFHRKTGFTLLEVLLAVAVLFIGLMAVFQTTRSALQTMNTAKELAEAQNACQALLNELLAQSAPIQADEGKAIERLPDWQIQVEIYPAPQTGLYVLHLSVLHGSEMQRDVKYQLVRWLPEERVQVSAESSTSSDISIGNEFEDLFR
ncbi:MAG: prepilin-type N-terminal cleavage/methylation domain-containing protein [Planctomycetaceae bacterium]|nr:prepilin-type N-terminal cleavage/methylation domain-containing protein [Planctomycetaceae bacterium]